MAWTAPRTWVTAEVVTAGNMNTHVRDNFLETGPAKVTTAGDIVYATGASAFARLGLGDFAANSQNPKYVTKTADESVTSSTAYQDDDDLLLAVGANEVWLVEAIILIKSNSTANFKLKWTVPSGATAYHFLLVRSAGGSFSGDLESATSPRSAEGLDATIAHPAPALIRLIITTSGTSGDLQFQWAQDTSNGTATQVLKGSYLRALQIT